VPLATWTAFLVKETIEICLHSNSFSWEDGLMLIIVWHPITKLIKERKEVPKEKQGQTQQSVDSAHWPYWLVSVHKP